jgi:hypothetical protein
MASERIWLVKPRDNWRGIKSSYSFKLLEVDIPLTFYSTLRGHTHQWDGHFQLWIRIRIRIYKLFMIRIGPYSK